MKSALLLFVGVSLLFATSFATEVNADDGASVTTRSLTAQDYDYDYDDNAACTRWIFKAPAGQQIARAGYR